MVLRFFELTVSIAYFRMPRKRTETRPVAGVEIAEALGRAAGETRDLTEAVGDLPGALQRVHGFGRRGHGHFASVELQPVPDVRAVARGDDDVVLHIGAVDRVAAVFDLLLRQGEAAPGAVDVAGVQLDADVLLFDHVHLQRPAQLLTELGRQLHVEAPVVAVVAVGEGEGVFIHADDEDARLGRLVGGERSGLLGEAHHVRAEPLARQLRDRPLGAELFERGGDVIIQAVAVAEGHRILLRDERDHGIHAVGDAAAAGERETQRQQEKQADQFFSHGTITVFSSFSSRGEAALTAVKSLPASCAACGRKAP